MQLFANNAVSVTVGTTLVGATTINVANGAVFPSPSGGDFFKATLVGLDVNGNESAWEIVKVTGRSSNALTVVRAQEGTTALEWAAGTRIELRATASTLADLEVSTATHAATGKTTPVDADELPLVDSAASNVLKKLTWANLKATLKTYFDSLYLAAAAIGSTVQGYDADTAKTDVVQTWDASQRTSETTDNDGSFDLNADLDFNSAPTGAVALTFTNIPATPTVQKGTVWFVNGSNYAITAHADTYIAAADLTKLSATGTYLISYRSSNGKVGCVVSAKLA